MTTTVSLETLRIMKLAMYQLRQDVGVPDTVESTASNTDTMWLKCKGAFDTAFGEVLNAHNWLWKRENTATSLVLEKPDNWGEDAKNALVYCCARELAVPIAGRTEDMKNLHSLYQEKLRLARLHDLETEVGAVDDPDVKEVLAAICPTIMSTDSSLPMDMLTILRRIDACKASAKAEILAAHNWSFAREVEQVESCECDYADPCYRFHCVMPAKCARVLECYTARGDKADWKVVGADIRSVLPIAAVMYLREDERTDKWNPLVRSAYISLLTSAVALTVAGSSSEASRQRELYERNLQTAKLADSRSTGSRKEVYGDNFYARAMRGGHDDMRSFPRWR